ncbi:MAG TPA: hypothetical protein VEZ88_10685 [Steroidobacteraceae bacterium]|nr:hypothetical protein [Steroidobacteraceae bacterium]
MSTAVAGRARNTEMHDTNLSLVDAFGKFGAKPATRMRGLSAIAADGAMVLNCSPPYFGHPAKGVLRYEDRLSREPIDTKDNGLLGEHLALARDGELPVRLIVKTPVDAGSNKHGRGFHVRRDLIGKLVKFDGDHFIVDFTRLPQMQIASRRK